MPHRGHYVLIGSIDYGELSFIDQGSSSMWKFLHLWKEPGEWLYQGSTLFEKFPSPQPWKGSLSYMPRESNILAMTERNQDEHLTHQILSHENQALRPSDWVNGGNEAWRSNRSITLNCVQIIRVIWKLVRNTNAHTSSHIYWIGDSGVGPRNLYFTSLLDASSVGYHWNRLLG